MPELAEVEFFRRQWLPGFGQPVAQVEVHPRARVFRGCETAALIRGLSGASLVESHAHGKQLLFGFSGGAWLGLHLGMTGEIRIDPPGTRPARHDHLVLRQTGRSLVFSDARMFGRVRFDLSPEAPPAWWTTLPPGLLSPGFSAPWLARHLARRARSPLKAVLLDQTVFPGVGNWMADEVLWQLGWHPLRPAGGVSQSECLALRRRCRAIARTALATIGVDWRDPPANWLYLHRWSADQPCPRPRCRTPLVREIAAGRTTCWCPACQPADGEAPRPSRKPVRSGHRREKPHHDSPRCDSDHF